MFIDDAVLAGVVTVGLMVGFLEVIAFFIYKGIDKDGKK